MTSVSASHIILTPTQPVGSRRPQRDLLTRSRALYRLSYRAPLIMDEGTLTVQDYKAFLKNERPAIALSRKYSYY